MFSPKSRLWLMQFFVFLSLLPPLPVAAAAADKTFIMRPTFGELSVTFHGIVRRSLGRRVQVIVAKGKGATIINGSRISSSVAVAAASWLLTHFLIKIRAIKRASPNRTKLF